MNALPLATHVEADQTVFTDGAREVFDLKVTPALLAERHWPRGLSHPLQLERAIDDVEVAIEQARVAHENRGTLIVTGSLARLWPFGRDGSRFSKDDVEAEFSQLVSSSSSGRPTEATRVYSGESAAALLLLREVLHHLGFTAIERRD